MRHKKLIIGTGICLLGIALSAAWFVPCKLEATYAGKTDNWVPVDLGYSIPEILRIENSPKPPLYFKVNPHYEDTLAFKMPYFDMDYLEKHVRPEFDEISEIIPISPEDYQKSIKYEDVCTSARN